MGSGKVGVLRTVELVTSVGSCADRTIVACAAAAPTSLPHTKGHYVDHNLGSELCTAWISELARHDSGTEPLRKRKRK
eukprot:2400315-Amphidinium_carterae.1